MAGLVDDNTGAVTAPTTQSATATNATSTDANATGYNAAQDQAATMTASTGTASNAALDTNNVASNQTVAGQLSGLIDDNSPLLQQARSQAEQSANAKGLLNSSMADTGAESAVLNEALPIAEQDATTNFNNAENNMNATNQNAQYNASNDQAMTTTNLGAENNASQTNVGNQQQTGLANQSATDTANQYDASAQNAANSQNAQQDTQTSQFNATQDNSTSQFNASQANAAATSAMNDTVQTYIDSQDNQDKVQLQQMDDDNKTQLANIQAQYSELLQSSQSAEDIYKSVVGNVTSIMTDQNMDSAAKQAAVNQQMQLLQSGMSVAGQVANVDLGSLLDFSSSDIADQANPNANPAPLTDTNDPAQTNDQNLLAGGGPN